MIFYSSTAGREAEVAEIWRECFPEDSRGYIDWLMANKYDPRLCYALADEQAGERIAALLHLLPLKLNLSGRVVDLPFVYGAGTRGEYRKQGHMRTLLQQTFAEQRRNGACCMALYPFEYGFYRKTGFGLLDECAACEFLVTELQKQSARWLQPGGILGPLTAEDMLSVWAAGIGRFEVCPVRDAARCTLRLDEWRSDGGSSVCWQKDGEARAYALFAPIEGKLEVEELFYADGEALSALLIALVKAAEVAGCTLLRCELPGSEFPHHLFADSRRAAFRAPHAMFRIIDVVGLIQGLKTSAEGSFCLRVEDELCPWNDGAFTFSCKNGSMAATPGGTPEGSCSIATLSSLVCGSMDGVTARSHSLLQTDCQAALGAFPAKKACFFEHY